MDGNGVGEKEVLAEYLKQFELRMKEAGGAGDCQFKAVSMAMHGEATAHVGLRAMCVAELRKSVGDWTAFVQGSYQSYCTAMAKQGTWGDHLTLQAMACMLEKDMQVFSVRDEKVRVLKLQSAGEGRRGAAISLAYLGGCHYMCIHASDKGELSLEERARRAMSGGALESEDAEWMVPQPKCVADGGFAQGGAKKKATGTLTLLRSSWVGKELVSWGEVGERSAGVCLVPPGKEAEAEQKIPRSPGVTWVGFAPFPRSGGVKVQQCAMGREGNGGVFLGATNTTVYVVGDARPGKDGGGKRAAAVLRMAEIHVAMRNVQDLASSGRCMRAAVEKWGGNLRGDPVVHEKLVLGKADVRGWGAWGGWSAPAFASASAATSTPTPPPHPQAHPPRAQQKRPTPATTTSPTPSVPTPAAAPQDASHHQKWEELERRMGERVDRLVGERLQSLLKETVSSVTEMTAQIRKEQAEQRKDQQAFMDGVMRLLTKADTTQPASDAGVERMEETVPANLAGKRDTRSGSSGRQSPRRKMKIAEPTPPAASTNVEQQGTDNATNDEVGVGEDPVLPDGVSEQADEASDAGDVQMEETMPANLAGKRDTRSGSSGIQSQSPRRRRKVEETTAPAASTNVEEQADAIGADVVGMGEEAVLPECVSPTSNEDGEMASAMSSPAPVPLSPPSDAMEADEVEIPPPVSMAGKRDTRSGSSGIAQLSPRRRARIDLPAPQSRTRSQSLPVESEWLQEGDLMVYCVDQMRFDVVVVKMTVEGVEIAFGPLQGHPNRTVPRSCLFGRTK